MFWPIFWPNQAGSTGRLTWNDQNGVEDNVSASQSLARSSRTLPFSFLMRRHQDWIRLWSVRSTTRSGLEGVPS